MSDTKPLKTNDSSNRSNGVDQDYEKMMQERNQIK